MTVQKSGGGTTTGTVVTKKSAEENGHLILTPKDLQQVFSGLETSEHPEILKVYGKPRYPSAVINMMRQQFLTSPLLFNVTLHFPSMGDYDAGVVIAGAQRLPLLKQFDLQCFQIGPHIWKALSQLVSTGAYLEDLKVEGQWIRRKLGSSRLELASPVGTMAKSLKKLALKGCYLVHPDVRTFVQDVLECNELFSLDLSSSRISSSFASLAISRGSLKELSLDYCRLLSTDIIEIVNAMKQNDTVSSLSIRNNWIGNPIHVFSHLMKVLPRLEQFDRLIFEQKRACTLIRRVNGNETSTRTLIKLHCDTTELLIDGPISHTTVMSAINIHSSCLRKLHLKNLPIWATDGEAILTAASNIRSLRELDVTVSHTDTARLAFQPAVYRRLAELLPHFHDLKKISISGRDLPSSISGLLVLNLFHPTCGVETLSCGAVDYDQGTLKIGGPIDGRFLVAPILGDRIRKLVVQSCDEASVISILNAALYSDALLHVELDFTGVNNETLARIGGLLPRFRQLERLSRSSYAERVLSAGSVSAFVDGLLDQNCSLSKIELCTSLRYSKGELTIINGAVEVHRVLRAIRNTGRLSDLKLQCNLRDEHLSLIMEAVAQNDKVRKVNILGNNFTPAALSKVTEWLPRLKCLEELQIQNYATLSEDILNSVETGLQQNTSLKVLNIGLTEGTTTSLVAQRILLLLDLNRVGRKVIQPVPGRDKDLPVVLYPRLIERVGNRTLFYCYNWKTIKYDATFMFVRGLPW